MRVISGLLFLFCCSGAFGQEIAPPEKEDYVSVLEAIAPGVPESGRWTLADGRLTQTDESARAAKYRLPFAQEKTDYIFSFTLSAPGTGWAGGGLHVFASGSERKGAYGHGDSLLVWLTRDEGYYKSKHAYLQLYRSFSDGLMVQLASVSVLEDVAREARVEIYYSAANEMISLSVNEDLKLFFPLKGVEMRGTEVVFRALGGPVVFSGLRIRKALGK